MWPSSSCGSPSSDIMSTQRCSSRSRPPCGSEKQSLDSEEIFCGCWEPSMSIFCPFLQQSGLLQLSLPQPGFACSTSRSSMLSETSLTVGGGFFKVRMMLFMIWSSCCVTCCRRWVTEAGTGLSGWWIWHQHRTALWEETQIGNSVNTENWLEQASNELKRNFNYSQNKAESGCFWTKMTLTQKAVHIIVIQVKIWNKHWKKKNICKVGFLLVNSVVFVIR